MSEGIDITNPAKALGIASFGNGVVETDNLIALQAGGFVDGLGANPLAIEALPGPGDEEGAGLMQMIESSEIQVTAIHQVNGAGFPDQLIEDVDLVNLSAGHNDHGRNAAAQIQQRMQFDGGFVASELGPREQRQTQIDGGGIERVHGLIEFQAEGVVGVKTPGHADQHVREIGVDFPVPHLIRVGQRVARDGAANSAVIEFGRRGPQTGFDIAQALSKSQLGKGHREKLVPTRETLDFVVAVVALDATAKLVTRNKVHQLGKDRLAGIHPLAPFARVRKYGFGHIPISNR